MSSRLSEQILATDETLSAALRNGQAQLLDDLDPMLVVRRARFHGIVGLLVERSITADWPLDAKSALERLAFEQTAWELRHRTVLAELLASLGARAIPSLLMKGTALAYTLYPKPQLRHRGDTDILIAPEGLEEARRVIGNLGFKPDGGSAHAPRELQEAWRLDHSDGSEHVIDLHWAPLNLPLLADTFPLDKCWDAPQRVPRLGPHAVTLAAHNLLIHACLHRAGHRTAPYFVDGLAHRTGDRMIWALDIKLLGEALDGRAWDAVRRWAFDRGASQTIIDGLDYADRTLGSDLRRAMGPPGAGVGRVDRFMLYSGRRARALAALKAEPNWSARLRTAWAMLFPPGIGLRSALRRLAGFLRGSG